jgi:tetratricopeptide (TPR) repeat protein
MYQPAIERLEKIREQDPTYPVDLELGRLYYKIYQKGGLTPWVQMAESYGRADRKSLTKGDFQAYALALTQSNQFSTGVELTEYALKQYKNDHSLNESHLHCAIGLAHAEAEQDRQKKSADRNPERIVQLYKNAVAAAEQFFAVGLKERFNSTNYLWYGEALNGAKEYEKALEVYDNILKRPDLEKKSERLAYGHIATTMEDKANDYIKAGEYATAVKEYEAFVQERKAINRYEASMPSMLAGIYKVWAKNLDGQDQLDKYKAAETVYDQMAIDFPEYAELALYNKITVRTESKPKWNEEEPYDYLPALAENLSALLLSKGELTSRQKVMLAHSYFLLCFYNATNLKKGNKKLAIDYANKVLEIDPTHPGAAKVLEILTKKK